MSVYLIPLTLLMLFVYALFKHVPLYNTFSDGIRESLNLVISIFPYVCAIFISLELFRISGLSALCARAMSPLFHAIGLPSELSELMIMRPLSGNGSIAMLKTIFDTYGADSYISRCAAVIVGCSETIFYVTAVYFSTTKIKRLRYAIPVSIFSCFFGAQIACLICRFI